MLNIITSGIFVHQIKKFSLVVSSVLLGIQVFQLPVTAQMSEVDREIAAVKHVCVSAKGKINNLTCQIAGLRIGAKQLSDAGRTSVSSKRVSSLGNFCKEVTLSSLKSPGSAKFPTTAKTTEFFVGLYAVNGKVDAQNSYGALLRGDYYCYFRNDSKKGFQLLDSGIETQK